MTTAWDSWGVGGPTENTFGAGLSSFEMSYDIICAWDSWTASWMIGW